MSPGTSIDTWPGPPTRGGSRITTTTADRPDNPTDPVPGDHIAHGPFDERAVAGSHTVRAARRLHGARHLLQAGALAGNATRKWRLLGVALPVTRAITMVPVVAFPDRRRSVALSALVSLVFAAVEGRSMFD